MQAEGGLCRPLRIDRRLRRVRVSAVCLDANGIDYLGNYQGRTGQPLYAIEYPDGELIFIRFPAAKSLHIALKRAYPKCEIQFGDIRGLNPWSKILDDLWPFKQFELFDDVPDLAKIGKE